MSKQQKKSRMLWISVVSALVVIGGIAAVIILGHKKGDSQYPLSVGPTIEDEGTKRQQQDDVSSAPGSASSTSLKAPTLTKSSGNNGPVPPGAIIEFVCESINGATCDIVLVDTGSSNSTINLGGKTITDDGRGQSAVLWNWTALKGTWKVAAKATKDGSTTSSQQQTLEVK